MIVGLRNFHKRKDVVPDSNFWCGCPVKTGILLGEKVLFGVYISKRCYCKRLFGLTPTELRSESKKDKI